MNPVTRRTESHIDLDLRRFAILST